MKAIFFLLINLLSITQIHSQENVLVFYKTEGFYHASIPRGIQTLKAIAGNNDFRLEATKSSKVFNTSILNTYDLLIFLNTSGDILNELEQVAFKNYIQNGGSFFGIHAAADTEPEWDWYVWLVGAKFKNHPPVTIAKIENLKKDHPVVSHLPALWTRKDEWYNFKELQSDNKVLLNLLESSYRGGENGNFHPVAWYKETGFGGISVYTAGGHTASSYSDTLFVEHLRRAILYALKKQDLIKP